MVKGVNDMSAWKNPQTAALADGMTRTHNGYSVIADTVTAAKAGKRSAADLGKDLQAVIYAQDVPDVFKELVAVALRQVDFEEIAEALLTD